MTRNLLPTRAIQFAALGAVALGLAWTTPAVAGTATYSNENDAVQINDPNLSYTATGISLNQRFPPAYVPLPTESGNLSSGPLDFSYTVTIADVPNTPASPTSFVGPNVAINGRNISWLYGQDEGEVVLFPSEGQGGPNYTEEEAPAAPTGMRIRRENNVLLFDYRFSEFAPWLTATDTITLSGADATAPVDFSFIWTIAAELTSIEVTGVGVPEVDQGGGEGEGEGEGEEPSGPEGPGTALYTDGRDQIKIAGASYSGGFLEFSGAPNAVILPRAGGVLDGIPAGNFSYRVDIASVGAPAFPTGFFGVGVKLNGADYFLLYRTNSPSGTPVQVSAARGAGPGALSLGAVIVTEAPTQLLVTRSGNTLSFSFVAGNNKSLTNVGSVDLSDPFGNGSVDDSNGEAQFDLYPFLPSTVSEIEVSGNPMYSVNDQYPFGPDAELPATSGAGMAVFAALLACAGGLMLRRKPMGNRALK